MFNWYHQNFQVEQTEEFCIELVQFKKTPLCYEKDQPAMKAQQAAAR